MSLTLPSAYSTVSKAGNISENWIIHLGFFNGDAQGKGDGGWDAVLQSNGNANLLNEAVTSDPLETQIDVDDGTVFTVGDYIKVNNEIILITAISTNTLVVSRNAMSTTADSHSNNDPIYWNNFTPIAMSNTTVDSVFHHGVVTNFSPIRTSFDLSNSITKTGNITLDLVNFEYQGDDFSAELLFGTRSYINRSVKIYSQLNNESDLSDCLQIYQGRLVDISHNDSEIRLTITEQRPWDFITIPQVKSPNNIYIPVVYGNYTGNASSGFCTNKTLFPIPQESHSTENCYYIAPRALDNGSGNETSAHWYESGLDRFIPINNTVTSTLTDGNSELIIFPTIMERTFKFRPIRIKSDNMWTDGANVFDTNATTYAYHNVSGTGAFTSTDQYLRLELGELTGLCSALTMTVAGSARITDAGSGVGEHARIRFDSYGLTQDIFSIYSAETGSGVGTDSSSYYNNTSILSNYQANGNILDELTIRSFFSFGSGSYAGSNRITDIQFLTTIDLNDPDGTAAQRSNGARKVLEDKIIYLACDGLTNSFSGGSGTATTGLQMHRDLLARFTNYDEADSSIYNWDDSYPANTDSGTNLDEDLAIGETDINVQDGTKFQVNDIIEIDAEKMLITNIASNTLTVTRGYLGTTAVDTHEDGDDIYIVNSLCVEDHRITTAWNTRWWTLEPIKLEAVLQKVQKEFAFIFKWRADGSGSYWIIKNQYSSNDVVRTFNKYDINNLSINNIPFSDLITKMEVSYEKHPAQNRYLSSVTVSDTTNNPRIAWGIQSKENISDIKLDMNVNKPGNANPGGGSPNDGYADYYMNLFGTVKKVISFSAVNPAKCYDLETGDIIQFSNTSGEMPVDPFGDNWADYYCITDMERSPGNIKITAREVG